MLNAEITRLLDKLYDLKKEDSTLIMSIKEEKEDCINQRDELINQRDELQSKIDSLSSEEKVLVSEGEDLKIALAKVSNDNYATILKKLNIDFDPYSIGKEVDYKLPIIINEVATEKEISIKTLEETEELLDNIILKIDELDIKHDEVISNQMRLKHYFDLAMKSEINITRDEMTSLLLTFDMSEEDARETAKLIMFPEDGLFEYDENIRNLKTKKSMKEIFDNARNLEQEKVNETVIETPASIDKPKEEIVEVKEDIVEEPIAPVIEKIENKETDKISKEELLKFLNEKGIDSLDFTNNDFEILISNFNKQLFEKNIKLINDININSDIYADNVELLYDEELEKKINVLLEVGKSAQDIYLNPNVLTKYNLSKLKEAIDVLKSNNLNPKDIPLIAY